MAHQVFYSIIGFVLFGAIQAAWIDHSNRGGALKHNHKRQTEGDCFYNMCNETDDYPEDEIRKLVEKTPGYKELFGTVLKPSREIFIGSRNGDDEDVEEGKEKNMCGTTTYYIAPKTAVDVDGVKHYVVNGDGMEQLIEYETCDEGTSCVADGQIPGYAISCRVQEVIIRLSVFTKTSSGDQALQLKSFVIPAGCYCAAKFDNFRAGRQ